MLLAKSKESKNSNRSNKETPFPTMLSLKKLFPTFLLQRKFSPKKWGLVIFLTFLSSLVIPVSFAQSDSSEQKASSNEVATSAQDKSEPSETTLPHSNDDSNEATLEPESSTAETSSVEEQTYPSNGFGPLIQTPKLQAQPDATSSGQSMASVITVALALLAVVVFIFFLAFLMRKFSFHQGGGGQIKTVASIMVGTRERIAVIQVGEEQHLIGVTSQNINHLAKLENPLPEGQNKVAFKGTFANLLQQQKEIQGKNS